MDKPQSPHHVLHAASRNAHALQYVEPSSRDPDAEPEEDLEPEEEAAEYYPVGYDEDGFPVEFKKEVSVSLLHSVEAREVCVMLSAYFAEQGQVVTVAQEWPILHDPNAKRHYPPSPDVMVLREVKLDSEALLARRPRKENASYRMWLHGGRPPDWALEISSEKTWRNDISELPRGKLTKYNRVGVPEYVVLDREGEWIKPALRMWKRVEGRLAEVVPDARGGFWSEALGLWLGVEKWEGLNRLLFYRRDGTRVPRMDERMAEERRHAKEADQRAEEERQRAEEANQRAEEERQRAEALEYRLAELEAQLSR